MDSKSASDVSIHKTAAFVHLQHLSSLFVSTSNSIRSNEENLVRLATSLIMSLNSILTNVHDNQDKDVIKENRALAIMLVRNIGCHMLTFCT